MTPEEKIADARLRRTYGISLSEFNQRMAAQGGVCAICKRPPVNYRLNVDHDHRFDRIKIKVHRPPTIHEWFAETVTNPLHMAHVWGATRKDARKMLKRILRRHSVRGLLCFSCNKGLSYYRDIPERFEAAAEYLKKYQSSQAAQVPHEILSPPVVPVSSPVERVQ